MDRYVNMFVRMFMRQVMSRGIRAGFDVVEKQLDPSKRRGPQPQKRRREDIEPEAQAAPRVWPVPPEPQPAPRQAVQTPPPPPVQDGPWGEPAREYPEEPVAEEYVEEFVEEEAVIITPPPPPPAPESIVEMGEQPPAPRERQPQRPAESRGPGKVQQAREAAQRARQAARS